MILHLIDHSSIDPYGEILLLFALIKHVEVGSNTWDLFKLEFDGWVLLIEVNWLDDIFPFFHILNGKELVALNLHIGLLILEDAGLREISWIRKLYFDWVARTPSLFLIKKLHDILLNCGVSL